MTAVCRPMICLYNLGPGFAPRFMMRRSAFPVWLLLHSVCHCFLPFSLNVRFSADLRGGGGCRESKRATVIIALVGGFVAALFATSSASSFPAIPSWPGIQHIVIWSVGF